MGSEAAEECNEFVQCRPFLKWVGGKTQLLPELMSRVPEFSGTYFEPFLGGGALLFMLQPKRAYVTDVNEELVNCYEVVQQQLEALCKDLKQHRYEKDYYYAMRDVDRAPEFKAWTRVQRASRLIYLNKTCFNGLYRVNSKGHFNVPFGKYTNPTILDAENLAACSKALADVTVGAESFLEAEKRMGKGDFVYFDPPYVPLSTTAYFTSYNVNGFDAEMQRELCELCRRLDTRGVKFMLSNSSAPFVLELYKEFKVERVRANRAINSKGEKRGKVDEVIVQNF